MSKKRTVVFLALAAFLFCGCGEAETTPEEPVAEAAAEAASTEESASPYVYYLHTDADCQSIWERMGETFSRRTGIPVTIEYVDAEDYDIRLQQVMAKREMPTAFMVTDLQAAYAWDDYTAELSETALGKKLRYPSEYFFYCGKAAGFPDRAAKERRYVALNAQSEEPALDATEKFFSWIFSSAEGRRSFPNRGYADCYR